jgi:transcriptional repressor NrdR
MMSQWFRAPVNPLRGALRDADKESLKVIDSRACEGGRAIRRRRECLRCSKRFTTYERVEDQIKLTVIKKDGSRVPWDRARVMSGLERACYKRPVEAGELTRIVEEVEDEIFRSHDKEVPSSAIGQMVSDRLRRVDQVAYVRFASVYRQFKTLEDLVDEAKAVIDAQRYEVPGQGRLFVEPTAAAQAPINGEEAAPGNASKGPGRGRRSAKPASTSPPTPDSKLKATTRIPQPRPEPQPNEHT